MLKNIKSKYILENIFNHVNNKLKLKIIKYNKNISQKLNITIEEYKVYNTIKKLNENFELNIKDINVEELDLCHKRLGTKEQSNKYYAKILKDIKLLDNIKLENLKILCLAWNWITDIRLLMNSKLEKLELLNLNYNYIRDINVLEKVKFPELKELFLGDNEISDINVLEKVNFEKLEILKLSFNKIHDIKKS